MAGLNLIPNPTVLIVQGGLFLTALAVVKNYFIAPYLKVRSYQESTTHGSEKKAEQLNTENQAIESEIEEQIQATLSQTKSMFSTMRQQALEERSKMITEAEQIAKKTLTSMRDQIGRQVELERERIPAVVKKLSEQLYQQSLEQRS